MIFGAILWRPKAGYFGRDSDMKRLFSDCTRSCNCRFGRPSNGQGSGHVEAHLQGGRRYAGRQDLAVAMWMNGYVHGKAGNSMVDGDKAEANAAKVAAYCKKNPDATLTSAIEASPRCSRRETWVPPQRRRRSALPVPLAKNRLD